MDFHFVSHCGIGILVCCLFCPFLYGVLHAVYFKRKHTALAVISTKPAPRNKTQTQTFPGQEKKKERKTKKKKNALHVDDRFFIVQLVMEDFENLYSEKEIFMSMTPQYLKQVF